MTRRDQILRQDDIFEVFKPISKEQIDDDPYDDTCDYCLACSGSGEANYSGSVCFTCKGTGHSKPKKERIYK